MFSPYEAILQKLYKLGKVKQSPAKDFLIYFVGLS